MGSAGALVLGGGGGAGAAAQGNKRFAKLFAFLGLLIIRCTSALLSGGYGRGLNFGVCGEGRGAVSSQEAGGVREGKSCTLTIGASTARIPTTFHS